VAWEMRSDNVNALHDGNRDWQGVNDFSPNITTTGFVQTAWNDNFNGIFNANSVLQALETKGSVITDASLKTRFTAETRFLRAFYYFQLVRTFGKVPLIDKALTASEVETVPRSSVAEVYKLIISDLEYAQKFASIIHRYQYRSCDFLCGKRAIGFGVFNTFRSNLQY
jgi:hypothetical protein